MTGTKCLICRGTDFTELLHIEKFPVLFGAVPADKRNQIPSFPLTIDICDQCHLVQQTNLLEEDVLNRVYTEEYYNCPSPLATGMGTRDIEKFYDFFRQCRLEKGKLLEIACFDGYLLKKLQKDGWDVYGCDPSALTKMAIDQLGRDRIINDFFTVETYPPETFDIVIFRNLLEHLYDIHGFMLAVCRCLKRGGRIFIDVPNVRVLLDIGGFGTFFHQHLSYFSLFTLSRLLGQHHFKIDNYFEGNPNLLVSAVKNANESHIINLGNDALDITMEKSLFLQRNRKTRNEITNVFLNPNHQRIAFFGASVLATTIVNLMEMKLVSKIKHIFDNDSMKHGKYIYGCDVKIDPPSGIGDADIDVIIITTYFFQQEIYGQLVEMGVDHKKIMTLN